MDTASSPAEIRRRLRNPVNGRDSTELDGVHSEAELRKERIAAAPMRAKRVIHDIPNLSLRRQPKKPPSGRRRRLLSAENPEPPLLPIEPPRPTVKAIAEAVAKYFHLGVDEIVSERRDLPIVRARHIVMYLSRELTLRTLTEIGRLVGNRDHSTTRFAIHKIADSLHADGRLRLDIHSLKQVIRTSPESATSRD